MMFHMGPVQAPPDGATWENVPCGTLHVHNGTLRYVSWKKTPLSPEIGPIHE